MQLARDISWFNSLLPYLEHILSSENNNSILTVSKMFWTIHALELELSGAKAPKHQYPIQLHLCIYDKFLWQPTNQPIVYGATLAMY